MASIGRGRGRARQEILRSNVAPPLHTIQASPDSAKSANENDHYKQNTFKCPSIFRHIFEYTEEELQREDCSNSDDEYAISHTLQMILPLVPRGKQYMARSSVETVPKYHSDMKQTSEHIWEGMEIVCVTGAVWNPSEMYLVMERDWMKKVDEIVKFVSEFYDHISSVLNRYTWFPEQDDIKPDLMVAAYIKSDKQWFRGRILDRKENKNDEIARFSVQLVDTGETHTVKETDIFYLDSYFMDEPQLSIKCRLSVDPKLRKYHTGAIDWPKTVGKKMRKVLFDKRFYTKFIRCVEQKGEMVWEVSIEGFKDEPRNPAAIHQVISNEVERVEREDFIWKRLQRR